LSTGGDQLGDHDHKSVCLRVTHIVQTETVVGGSRHCKYMYCAIQCRDIPHVCLVMVSGGKVRTTDMRTGGQTQP
jgi:hypothetical protein